MQDINLLQSKIKDREELWQKNNRTANIVLSLILVLVVAAGLVFWYLVGGTEDKLTQTTAETVKIQSEIDAQSETLDTAKAYQAQLKNLKLVLSDHVAWSNLLDELAKATYKDAELLSIQGTLTGAIHLEGRTDTYEKLAKVILGLSTSKAFESVKLLSSDGSIDENTGYNFSMDLTVSPNTFIPR
jgi:Tfp pilus assembly protein PilN